MRKMMKAIAAVMAVSALMAGSAFAAPKFTVKGTDGTTDKFVVGDDGSVTTAGFVYNGTTQMFGMGTTTPSAALSVTAATTSSSRGLVISQHNTGAQSAVAGFRKSRGTELAPTTVVSGDYIGTFMFKNYDGTNWVRNAGFGARVNGTVATGSVPTEIFFWSNPIDTADAYGTNSVKLMISAAGNVGIGTVTPTSKLQVVGLPTYDTVSDAQTAGLTSGAIFKTTANVLMIVP